MRVLSFDTSSPACTVAVVDATSDAADLMAEINAWTPRGHMARLLPQIDTTLRETGIAKEELEAVVVGLGPGSFTGLRIGVTIARTLAQLLDIPIVGVPSLDAIARRVGAFEGAICTIIDAKREEVYAAVYESSGGSIKRLTDFKPLSPESLVYELAEENIPRVLLVGDGISAHRKVFEGHLGGRAVFSPRDFWWPRAADLAAIAAPRLVEGAVDDLFSLVPIYARLSQAEELWLKKEHA